MSILDQGKGVSSTMLIGGSGRSGTTWIADVVAHATQSRLVFEPFLQNAHQRCKSTASSICRPGAHRRRTTRS